MMKTLLLAVFWVLGAATVALADDRAQHYNQVRLQSEQREAVSNDTMHVTLGTSGESMDAAKLARRINADMEWALATAEGLDKIKASTGSYQTWPVHHKTEFQGWRAQQTLMLEGTDMEGLSQLTGQLQERLQVKSMNFTVSDAQRTAVENRLISAALEAFKERARIVGDNLQATGFRIVELNVNTGRQPPPVIYQARVAASAMESDAGVAVAGGETDIVVTLSGTIELQMP
jgi:predicted secreted protein